MAHLYGIDAPPVDRARVLTLGCGNGESILPFAAGYPNAEILGVDIDPVAVEDGQQYLQTASIQNLQLYALDISSLLAQQELGLFDYILIGGVFSLVDSSTRLEILKFCQRHLSPTGIATFEYSTHPGSKVNEIVRDALVLHSSLATTEDQTIGSARAMLAFLNQGLAPANPLSGPIKQLAEQAEHYGDVELALKYLQSLNEPCYFVEFNDLATQAGLCYVGDAQPHLELPEAWGANVAQLYAAINPSQNKILGQQYLDFACNRQSRMSILTAQSRVSSVLPAPDSRRLKDLRWGGYFKRVSVKDSIADGHHNAVGQLIVTDGAIPLAILDTIGYAWPASVDFDTVRFNSLQPIDTLKSGHGNHDEQLVETLYSLFIKLGGALKYSLDPSPYDNAASRYLAPSPGRGLENSAPGKAPFLNLWHEAAPSALDALDLSVLAQLNGQMPIAQLAKNLDAGEGGYEDDIGARLSQSLNKLYKHGLLQGANSAWIDYWKHELGTATLARNDIHPVCSLMMHSFPPTKGGIAKKSATTAKQPAGQRIDKIAPVIKQIRRCVQNSQPAMALERARQLVKAHPDIGAAWAELHRTLLLTHGTEGLLEATLRALALSSDDVNYYVDTAAAFRSLHFPWNSRQLTEKVLRLEPKHAVAWSHLGHHYGLRHALSDAELCYRQAIKLEPTLHGALTNLASTLSNQSRTGEALALYEKAIERAPNNYVLHSNYLFCCLHSNELTPDEIFRRHRRYGEKVESRPKQPIDHNRLDKNPDRQLRLGFVSADLRNHAVTYFLEPYLANLDRNAFSIHVYSNMAIEDEVTERLKSYADSWDQVSTLNDDQLAKLIADAQIDILFDLSGHTAYNRLPMFAYKPAPIQITWIGYPGTTGLKAMDYALMSRHYAQPTPLDGQFTEKPLYLDINYPFKPHHRLPDLNRLPSLDGAPFTFGSFNRPQKLSDEVLRTWADILHAVPGSRLLQGNMEQNAENTMTNRFLGKMAEFGIPAERLLLRKRANIDEYLKMHGEIDLLLDTFPYTGGTTTSHALCMGVPTLTMTGDTRVSRVGAVIMRRWGLDGFVARSVREYVDLAAHWAQRGEELDGIRQNLRPSMAASTGDDDAAATRMLEKSLRHVWQRWCAGQAPETTLLTA